MLIKQPSIDLANFFVHHNDKKSLSLSQVIFLPQNWRVFPQKGGPYFVDFIHHQLIPAQSHSEFPVKLVTVLIIRLPKDLNISQ